MLSRSTTEATLEISDGMLSAWANDKTADRYEYHGYTLQRLPLATPEMVADAERWRYVCDNSGWERRIETIRYAADGSPIEEEWTFLTVRVLNGSDLSCAPMRENAIDAARAAGGKA
jgi:hypothetical protein